MNMRNMFTVSRSTRRNMQYIEKDQPSRTIGMFGMRSQTSSCSAMMQTSDGTPLAAVRLSIIRKLAVTKLRIKRLKVSENRFSHQPSNTARLTRRRLAQNFREACNFADMEATVGGRKQ